VAACRGVRLARLLAGRLLAGRRLAGCFALLAPLALGGPAAWAEETATVASVNTTMIHRAAVMPSDGASGMPVRGRRVFHAIAGMEAIAPTRVETSGCRSGGSCARHHRAHAHARPGA
jgi:hypothetical protein